MRSTFAFAPPQPTPALHPRLEPSPRTPALSLLLAKVRCSCCDVGPPFPPFAFALQGITGSFGHSIPRPLVVVCSGCSTPEPHANAAVNLDGNAGKPLRGDEKLPPKSARLSF